MSQARILSRSTGFSRSGIAFTDKRGDPRGQIRIDRPASVVTVRALQKLDAAFDNNVRSFSRGNQAHHHEAGQRRGFEEAAARWLDLVEESQRAPRESACGVRG